MNVIVKRISQCASNGACNGVISCPCHIVYTVLARGILHKKHLLAFYLVVGNSIRVRGFTSHWARETLSELTSPKQCRREAVAYTAVMFGVD